MDFFLNKWRSVAKLPIPTNEIDESGDVQPTSTNEGNGSGDVQPTLNLNLEDEVTIVKEIGEASKRSHEDGVDVEVQPPPKRSSKQHNVRSEKEPILGHLCDIEADPGLRKMISDYHPNDRDVIRRAYWNNGPCQPKDHNFPQTLIGKKLRHFRSEWFAEFGKWLEYSKAKDAAYCLCCYLFRPDQGAQGSGGTFVRKGFVNWERKDKLNDHEGGVNSAHMQAFRMAEAFSKPNQSIQTLVFKHSNQARKDYRIQLTAVTDVVRFLLHQGLPFRGNHEGENSHNRGNYLELVSYTGDHNDEIGRVLKEASQNLQLSSSDIQVDLVNACATETTNAILEELGNAQFAILIDEARDVSIKEQMAMVVRYVNKKGGVVERFIGVVHVMDTSAKSLKEAIDVVFARHGLSITRLRGQGYDGASNMQGGLNGLKTLILKENESAFFIHCFAHQLQLALVAVAKKKPEVASLFSYVGMVLNVVGASCKRRDMLREKRAEELILAFGRGEITSGRGQNQETSLKRHCETRWGSHYGTLVNLVLMFSSVLDVLDDIAEDGLLAEQRGEAFGLCSSLRSFDFILSMCFMKKLLGISNDLSKALQRRDQDIVNAMALVKVCKIRIQAMRDDGWDSLLNEVSSICLKHDVVVPKMEDWHGRGRRTSSNITNLHYYRDLFFYASIDWQRQELDNRFNEVNTELLLCMSCLNPSHSFSAYDNKKLVRFAEFYPMDFSPTALSMLPEQLENWVCLLRSMDEFVKLDGISALALKMVETRMDVAFPSVYLLITLALILPVATATVERAFSAMKIIKTRLRNRMRDELLNDNMVTYIEKDIFINVDTEAIMQRFQRMKPRRGQL